jgi:hypothetical protein
VCGPVGAASVSELSLEVGDQRVVIAIAVEVVATVVTIGVVATAAGGGCLQTASGLSTRHHWVHCCRNARRQGRLGGFYVVHRGRERRVVVMSGGNPRAAGGLSTRYHGGHLRDRSARRHGRLGGFYVVHRGR